MEESRFKKHLKHQAYKNVLLATLGIAIVIGFLALFGTNILIGFGILAGNFSGSQQDTTTNTSSQTATSYIAPPTLNPSFDATNSASVTISGLATPQQEIALYVNGQLVDKTSANSDKTFTFKDITLQSGDNSLKAKAITDDNKQSDYSNEIKISFMNKAPQLSIDSPKDGDGYKKEESPVKVTGKTDPGVKVTVNDFRAIVDDTGTYSYLFTLQDGDNNIKVVATDDAGNQATKEIKIHTQ